MCPPMLLQRARLAAYLSLMFQPPACCSQHFITETIHSFIRAALAIYYQLSHGWVGIVIPGALWFVGTFAIMFVPQVRNCLEVHTRILDV
jgi:hypothetical protein